MVKNSSHVVVAALYRFVKLPDFKSFREPLYELMLQQGVRGTLLLASEGINGTIAGSREGIDNIFEWLQKDGRFSGLETTESHVDEIPFYRTKVKLKKEIVTMGEGNIDPNDIVGTYIEPKNWNELISDPDVLLLDTRNNYEVEIGTFENAISPKTNSFREFPAFAAKKLHPDENKKVAMFCTGGIRCEKSTAYLKQQGFEEVYHLRGGILKYLKEIPEQRSKWRGECFVFDNRVTVNHQLEKGSYDQCHACRMPITEEDKKNKHYQKGVSCNHCYEKNSRTQIRRYAERERQIELAKKRGETHLGQPIGQIREKRRREKLSFKKEQRKLERGKS